MELLSIHVNFYPQMIGEPFYFAGSSVMPKNEKAADVSGVTLRLPTSPLG